MRFSYPCLPGEFEIPDDWLAEVGMLGFHPSRNAYRSSSDAELTSLRIIEPPIRSPDTPKDWRGFERSRLIDVLRGIVEDAEIPPVPIVRRPQPKWVPAPFRYRVRVVDGYHRFFASVAAGFECLPTVLCPDQEKLAEGVEAAT